MERQEKWKITADSEQILCKNALIMGQLSEMVKRRCFITWNGNWFRKITNYKVALGSLWRLLKKTG